MELSLGRDGIGRALRLSRPPGVNLYWSLEFAARRSVSVLMYISVVGVLVLIVPLASQVRPPPRAVCFSTKRKHNVFLHSPIE